MFCRSKLLICFHAVAFFSIRVISAMYTVSALSKGGFSMHTNPVIMIARC